MKSCLGGRRTSQPAPINIKRNKRPVSSSKTPIIFKPHVLYFIPTRKRTFNPQSPQDSFAVGGKGRQSPLGKSQVNNTHHALAALNNMVKLESRLAYISSLGALDGKFSDRSSLDRSPE